MDQPQVDRRLAEQQVRGPAIALLVVGILGALTTLAGMVLSLTGALARFLESNHYRGDWDGRHPVVSVAFGLTSGLLNLAATALLLWGAVSMLRLRSYPLALTACILAVVPCTSPCCLLGIPFGIWGLVVIHDAAVRPAFDARGPT